MYSLLYSSYCTYFSPGKWCKFLRLDSECNSLLLLLYIYHLHISAIKASHWTGENSTKWLLPAIFKLLTMTWSLGVPREGSMHKTKQANNILDLNWKSEKGVVPNLWTPRKSVVTLTSYIICTYRAHVFIKCSIIWIIHLVFATILKQCSITRWR